MRRRKKIAKKKAKKKPKKRLNKRKLSKKRLRLVPSESEIFGILF
jgi:hypothetical protein